MNQQQINRTVVTQQDCFPQPEFFSSVFWCYILDTGRTEKMIGIPLTVGDFISAQLG